MIRRIAIWAGATVLAVSLGAGSALAGTGPSTTGEPFASCQDERTGPPGILSVTNGFATTAVVVYSGSDGAHSLVSGNGAAVSQYDVACLQVSTSH